MTITITEITEFLNAGGEFDLLSAISDPAPYFHPLTRRFLTREQRQMMKAVLQSKMRHRDKPLALVLASCADGNNQVHIDEES